MGKDVREGLEEEGRTMRDLGADVGKFFNIGGMEY